MPTERPRSPRSRPLLRARRRNMVTISRQSQNSATPAIGVMSSVTTRTAGGVAVEQVAVEADCRAGRPAERRRRIHDRDDQQQPDGGRPPDAPVQQQQKADRRQEDQDVLNREVVEVAGVLHHRVEQAFRRPSWVRNS